MTIKELNITIDTDKTCKIIILDNTNYIPEANNNTSKKGFKYSDTISIVVLEHNKTQKTIVKNPIFIEHSSKLLTIPIEFDGWFTVNYIVLPTKEWFDKEKAKTEGSALGAYSLVYYTDGKNIYKYIDGNSKQISIDEILLVNEINTTLLKTNLDYVSICFLKQCYINLCQLIFNSRGFSSCWNKNTIDSELVYKRDLVWMAINVIEYLTKLHSDCNPTLSEVQRLIEMITENCNGLCPSFNKIQNTGGCGCSKKS